MKKGKVFVGMSGGVDSSVSAAILCKQGYEVVGVFIKVWQPSFYDCNWKEDRLDAMRVAAKLGIPFYTLDLEAEYKKEVVDYMIEEYRQGRTPNPDVMCNKYIKFGGFFDWAIAQGADFVATGHYAEVKKKGDNFYLLAGADKNKDQSYFLWTLNQKQLFKTLFPVGGMKKTQVRALAKSFKLPNALKRDSQGLCFIGKVEMDEFLKHFIKSRPGEVKNLAGKTIGNHDGALFYTIGERHGFTINEKTPTDKRYYVVTKNIEQNTLTVDQGETNQAQKKEFILRDVHWIVGQTPNLKVEYRARTRYRHPLETCSLKVKENGQYSVKFKKFQRFVASGQSLVLYQGKSCLGGGIIV